MGVKLGDPDGNLEGNCKTSKLLGNMDGKLLGSLLRVVLGNPEGKSLGVSNNKAMKGE